MSEWLVPVTPLEARLVELPAMWDVTATAGDGARDVVQSSSPKLWLISIEIRAVDYLFGATAQYLM